MYRCTDVQDTRIPRYLRYYQLTGILGTDIQTPLTYIG